MTRPAVVVAAALLAACTGPKETRRNEFPDLRAEYVPPPAASSGSALTAAPAPAPAPPTASPAPQAGHDFKGIAANAANPAECANRAKELRASSPDAGWVMLRACIERGRFPRGDFTDLRLLLNGTWDEDLASRPDAVVAVAKMVALRGGDVEGDLKRVQEKRVPLFTLAAALKQPETYKGRFVVVRAQMEEMKSEAERHTAMLAETSMGAVTYEVEVGPKRNVSGGSSTRVSGEYQTSNYGSGRGSASVDSKYDRRYSTSVDRHDNQRSETGRKVLGRLAKPDPFLEPAKDYIFLVRFDGVRKGENDKPLAVVSVMAYFPPSALLVE